MPFAWFGGTIASSSPWKKITGFDNRFKWRTGERSW